jgi:hypothetical protein
MATLSTHNTEFEVSGYDGDISHMVRALVQVRMHTAPRKKWLRPGTESIIKRNSEKREPDTLDIEGRMVGYYFQRLLT